MHNSWSCLKLNSDFYADADVEVLNGFVLKRVLKVYH